MDKQLIRHLDSFSRAKDWEWHYLVNWISKLKEILESLPSYSPFAVQLSKRLTQCLSPAIPEMVHVASLHLFELLLSRGQCFPLFLDSLLGFFPTASIRLKSAVLGLIQKHCVKPGNDLAVPGLVFALLKCANEPETANQVTDMLDFLTATFGVAVQTAVVSAALKSRSVRLAALNYLKRRLQVEVHRQAANAILVALDDPSLIVRRAALDVLVTHLPLGVCDLPYTTMIYLATAGLKLLALKDLSLQRRLNDWVQAALEVSYNSSRLPHGSLGPSNGESAQSAPPKVSSHFYETTDHELVIKVILDATAQLIGGSSPDTLEVVAQLLHNQFLSQTLIDSLTIDIFKYLKRHPASPEQIRTAIGEGPLTQLFLSLCDRLQTHETCMVLDLLSFAVTELVADSSTVCQVRELLCRLMGGESVEVCSKILEIVQSSLLKDTGMMSPEAHRLIISLVHSEPELFPQASMIFSLSIHFLEEEWLQLIDEVAASNNIKAVHWCVVDLLKSDPTHISARMLGKIWGLVSTSEVNRVLVTLNECREAVPTQFFESLSESWLSPLVAVKTRRLHEFNRLWKYNKFKLQDTAFILMDLLEDSNPQVRHLAHQWLTNSLVKIDLVIDPLLEVLLKRQTKLARSAFGDLQYTHTYDFPRLLAAFNRLCALINRGGDDLKHALHTVEISEEAKGFNAEVSRFCKTYLELLCNLALFFISKNDANEGLNISSAACEFLELVLHKTTHTQVCKAAEVALKVAVDSIREDNPVMQMSLVNVLRVVFFECSLPSELAGDLLSTPHFKSLLLPALNTSREALSTHLIYQVNLKEPVSEPFALTSHAKPMKPRDPDVVMPFARGLLSNTSLYILNHWVDFIDDMIPMMTQLLSRPIVTDYFSSMLSSMSSILQTQTDNKAVVKALITLIRQALRHTDPEVALVVLQELDTVLEVCISRTKLPETPINISATSVLFDCSLQGLPGQESADLLVPVLALHPVQLMSAVISQWLKLTVLRPDSDSDLKLQKLLVLVVCLDMPMDVLLGTLLEFTRQQLKLEQTARRTGSTDKRELGIAHLMFALLASRVQLSNSQTQALALWEAVLKLVTELEHSVLGEAKLWGLALLQLLARRLPLEEAPKKLRRMLQDTVQRLVGFATGVMNSSSEIFNPQPSCIVGSKTLSLAATKVLMAAYVPLVLMAWNTEPEDKVVNQMQGVATQLLTAYRSKSSRLAQIGGLLECIVRHEGCCRHLKKDLLELVNSPSFFADLDRKCDVLKTFSSVIRHVLRTCFPDKGVIVAETFSRISTSVFTSRASEILQTQQALKMLAFFIFSGAVDDFAKTASQIFERLVDLMKEPLMSPAVFMCLRVLFLRLSRSVLAECWPRLWPHLFSQLPRALQRGASNETCSAALRLLELLSHLDLEDFHLIQWMFFIDVPDISFGREPSSGFVPSLGRAFLPDYQLEILPSRQSDYGEVNKVSLIPAESISECEAPPFCFSQAASGSLSRDSEAKKCDSCMNVEAFGKNLIQKDLAYKAQRTALDLDSVEELLASELLV
jgi:hypothetical protein